MTKKTNRDASLLRELSQVCGKNNSDPDVTKGQLQQILEEKGKYGAEFEIIIIDGDERALAWRSGNLSSEIEQALWQKNLDKFNFGTEDDKNWYNTLQVMFFMMNIKSDSMPYNLKEQGISFKYIDNDTCMKIYKKGEVGQEEIGKIIHDGLAYMPEFVTAPGTYSEVKEYANIIKSVLERGAGLIGGKLSTRQLGHICDEYGNLVDSSIPSIPAKNDGYYNYLVDVLGYWGRKIHSTNVRDALEKEFGQYADVNSLLDIFHGVEECFGKNFLKFYGYVHSVGTTSHHLHNSYGGVQNTLDVFIALLYYEGQLRCNLNSQCQYYKRIGKSKRRHYAFGSLVTLRYLISKKSHRFIEEKGWNLKNLQDNELQELRNNYLLPPELRVTSPIVDDYNTDYSLACRVHEMIEEKVKVKGSSRNEFKKEVVECIAKEYCGGDEEKEKEFVEAYLQNKPGLSFPVDRSHADNVLKSPASKKVGDELFYILTFEQRGQDYPLHDDSCNVMQCNMYIQALAIYELFQKVPLGDKN